MAQPLRHDQSVADTVQSDWVDGGMWQGHSSLPAAGLIARLSRDKRCNIQDLMAVDRIFCRWCG